MDGNIGNAPFKRPRSKCARHPIGFNLRLNPSDVVAEDDEVVRRRPGGAKLRDESEAAEAACVLMLLSSKLSIAKSLFGLGRHSFKADDP